MINERLDIPLKGSRNYIQGPSAWNAICVVLRRERWPEETQVTATFRHLTTNVPVFCLPASKNDQRNCFANVVLSNGKERQVGSLVLESEIITERVDDYEHHVKENLRLADDYGETSILPENMKPVEAAIAVTKFLHQAQVDSGVKWLATRLEFPISFHDTTYRTLGIKIARQVKGLATVSDVLLDGHVVGRIYFKAQPAVTN